MDFAACLEQLSTRELPHLQPLSTTQRREHWSQTLVKQAVGLYASCHASSLRASSMRWCAVPASFALERVLDASLGFATSGEAAAALADMTNLPGMWEQAVLRPARARGVLVLFQPECV